MHMDVCGHTCKHAHFVKVCQEFFLKRNVKAKWLGICDLILGMPALD